MQTTHAKALLDHLRAVTPAENRAWHEAAPCGDARRHLNEATKHLRAAERQVEIALKLMESHAHVR